MTTDKAVVLIVLVVPCMIMMVLGWLTQFYWAGRALYWSGVGGCLTCLLVAGVSFWVTYS